MAALYQYSSFLAVTKGCYDGELSIAELKQQGNLGLGTFNGLDGELIVVDDHFYHCAKGNVRIAKDSEQLPWAAVTKFDELQYFTVENIDNITALSDLLLQKIKLPNRILAFSMKAVVNNIDLGSVPKQRKPYKPIEEIIEQSIHIKTGPMSVDIAGFYAPEFMFPLKSQGLHLHFVNQQRNVGGHILDIDMHKADIHWQPMDSISIVFPDNDDYNNSDLCVDVTQENIPKFSDKLAHDATSRDI